MGISTKVSSSSLHDALSCYEQEQAWKHQSYRRVKLFMLSHLALPRNVRHVTPHHSPTLIGIISITNRLIY
jgi:hypothetical protein